MFLLNSILIRQYVESEDGKILDINEFNPKFLQHTFYYFRLGSECVVNGKAIKLTPKVKYLTLHPGDLAIIKSQEYFTLSDKILGLFGQTSDLSKEGLIVLHSPFIDPKFKGHLTLTIKNLNNVDVNLESEVTRIGKVCFFDVSDTYPIDIKRSSIIYKKFLDAE